MAHRRGRDRVVGYPTTGGSQFPDPSGTLPRSTYRDIEDVSGTWRPDRPVYRRLDDIVGTNFNRARKAAQFIASTPFRRSPPPPYRRPFFLPSYWRVQLSDMPSRVRMCVQRKQRREVLFAVKRAGYKGSAKKAHWRRNANSKYGC